MGVLGLLALTAALAGPPDEPSDVPRPRTNVPPVEVEGGQGEDRAVVAAEEDADEGLLSRQKAEEIEDVVVVQTRRPVDAPCRRLLDRAAIREMPVRGAPALLQAVPGVVQTTRLGLGAPLDTAWRGLTGRRGQAIALDLEGVPLNEPANLGGHGLADGWSLPMALIESVDWCPGAALPDSGPVALSGRATLRLSRAVPGGWGEIGGGTDGSGRLALGWAPRTRDAGTFVHAEVDSGEGVGADRTWRHLRLAAGVTGSIDTVDVAAFLLAYDSRDDVQPLLREDDLLDDRVRFYGSYRDWTGTRTSRRLLLGTRLIHVASWGGIRGTAWFGLRGWQLDDDTSGFLFDANNGDGVAQRQAGQELGVKVDVSRRWSVLGDVSRLEGGAALQGWFSRQRVQDVDLLGNRLDLMSDHQLGTVSLAGWVRGRLGLGGLVALTPGLRVEQVEVRQQDRLDPDADAERSGRLMVRPDVALVVLPASTVDLHFSWGRGGLPPDARQLGATDPNAFLLDVLDGRLEARPLPWMNASISAFGMLGRDEPLRGPVLGEDLGVADTRRLGGELSLSVTPPGLPGQVPLTLGGDLAFADARRLDTRALLAYAPRWTGRIHANVRRWNLSNRRVQDLYLSVGVQLTWVGRYPLPDGFTARGWSATDIRTILDWRKWSFQVDLDNAIPWRWRQIEVFTPSRWDLGDAPTALPVRHLVAGRPSALRLTVSRRF